MHVKVDVCHILSLIVDILVSKWPRNTHQVNDQDYDLSNTTKYVYAEIEKISRYANLSTCFATSYVHQAYLFEERQH